MEPGKRAANLTAPERQLIVDLVAKYSQVLENKQTDSVTNAEKDAVWQQLGSEFNAVNAVKREAKQLKQVT